MSPLRRRIDPKKFTITGKQLAKYLNIDVKRILKWEKWQHVLWVHIEGRGGYFVSYRQLQQWIAACSSLIRYCNCAKELKILRWALNKEASRYEKGAIAYLFQLCAQQKVHLMQQAQILPAPQNLPNC